MERAGKGHLGVVQVERGEHGVSGGPLLRLLARNEPLVGGHLRRGGGATQKVRGEGGPGAPLQARTCSTSSRMFTGRLAT